MINACDDIPSHYNHICLRAAMQMLGYTPETLGAIVGVKPSRIADFLETGDLFDAHDKDRGGILYTECPRIFRQFAAEHGVTMAAFKRPGRVVFTVYLPEKGA